MPKPTFREIAEGMKGPAPKATVTVKAGSTPKQVTKSLKVKKGK